MQHLNESDRGPAQHEIGGSGSGQRRQAHGDQGGQSRGAGEQILSAVPLGQNSTHQRSHDETPEEGRANQRLDLLVPYKFSVLFLIIINYTLKKKTVTLFQIGLLD